MSTARNQPKIIIAVDGYSSCGKSTLAKDLAAKLAYTYVDSGAMYRAVTWYFLKHRVPLNDSKGVHEALEQVRIHFESVNGENHTILNDMDLENDIRSPEVSAFVSEVSAVSEVRRNLVTQQQNMGLNKGIVMDGRDIGTVVFPQAELKIFLTAELHIRAKRRHEELLEKGMGISFTDVMGNLVHRDQLDTTRADSPLRRADDAIELDNSRLSRQEQLEIALNWAMERIGQKSKIE